MENIIECRGLVYEYQDGARAVNGADICVKRGERLSVIGRNGSGKSTLFLLLNGVIEPSEGTYIYDGITVNFRKRDSKKIKRKIGIVFQNPDDQLFMTNVFSDICFGLFNLGYSRDEAENKALEVMRELEIEYLRDRPIHFLSGGEKKAVALAGVLAMEPEVILLDEPYAALDCINAKHLDEILDSLTERGIAIVMSEHNLDRVWRRSDRICVMDGGKVIKQGTTEGIFSEPEFIKEMFGEMPVLADMYFSMKKLRLLKEEKKPPQTAEELIKMIRR